MNRKSHVNHPWQVPLRAMVDGVLCDSDSSSNMLLAAVSNGKETEVAQLVAAGARLNSADAQGRAPLHIAAMLATPSAAKKAVRSTFDRLFQRDWDYTIAEGTQVQC